MADLSEAHRADAGRPEIPRIDETASPPPAAGLDRRQFIEGVAGTGALALLGPVVDGPAGASTSPAFSQEAFAHLAWGLTGYLVPDRQALRELYVALLRQIGTTDLERLHRVVGATEPSALDQALRTAGLDGPAQSVVRALYTGTVPGPGGQPRVITYDAALVWQACDFTKPPARCGGPTNYWGDPPARRL